MRQLTCMRNTRFGSTSLVAVRLWALSVAFRSRPLSTRAASTASTPALVDPAYIPSSADIAAANAELSEFWGETPSAEMEEADTTDSGLNSDAGNARPTPLHTQADIRHMQARINEQAAAAHQRQQLDSDSPPPPPLSPSLSSHRSTVEAAAAAAAERAATLVSSSSSVLSSTSSPAGVVVIHQHVHHHHHYYAAPAADASPAATTQVSPADRR